MSLSNQQQIYLQQHINNVAGFHLPLAALSEEIRSDIFSFLSRKEESDSKHRDQWGNWEGSFSLAFNEGKLAQPWIDDIISQTAREYIKIHPEIAIIPKYPDNKRFALCITHDVDNINYFSSLVCWHRALGRFIVSSSFSFEAIQLILLKSIKDAFTHRPNYLKKLDFYKFIELEGSLGFKSTFYCFSEQLKHPHYYDSYYSYSDLVYYKDKAISFKEMLQEIHALGWDIGLHGSYNSALDLEALRYEKQQLEQTLGFEINGTRQHWMHYEISKTPVLHNELGFTSDSTFGFNRFIGFRSGTSHPHKVWDIKNETSLDFWEIPLSIMDGALFYANAMELNEELAIRQCLTVMDRVEAVGGVLTINWHPDHLNKPRFRAVYKELLQEAARRNAWGCTATELASHWSSYYQKVNSNG